MPTTRDYELVMTPKFVADEGSLVRLGGGAQVDWTDITADADGIKKVLAGQLLGRDTDGLVAPVGAMSLTVTIAVTSNVATATLVAHGLAIGDRITIAGATPAALNGTHVITDVPDADTWEFATTAGDGAASGTITAVRAAYGIAIATTDDQLGNNKGMIGVYLGGVFYSNLMAAVPNATQEADLGNNFRFQTYADSRLV